MAEETPKGLEGVVVVELGDYVAMPACPRILVEMGATVYKIETPTGNLHRLDGPGFGMPSLEDNDPAMDMAGMNKNWLSIDMKTEEGKEFADKIIASADIFITSIRDKSLARLGYDYETLHKKYPKLVYGQMRGYGPRGPMRHAKGFDATCYAARGSLLMSIPQAGEHFQPGNLPAAFGDLNSSIALGMGLLAALYRAQKTGEGDFVTVNLYLRFPLSQANSTCPSPRIARQPPAPPTTPIVRRTASGSSSAMAPTTPGTPTSCVASACPNTPRILATPTAPPSTPTATSVRSSA